MFSCFCPSLKLSAKKQNLFGQLDQETRVGPKGYDSEACVNLNTLKIICSIFIMSSVMPHHQHHICMNDCDDDNDG